MRDAGETSLGAVHIEVLYRAELMLICAPGSNTRNVIVLRF